MSSRLSAKRTAIVVTGSRDWTDFDRIWERLRKYPAGPTTLVLHGKNGVLRPKFRVSPYIDDPEAHYRAQHDAWIGADRIAHAWALTLGMEPWPLAYFGDMGRRGGPGRNVTLAEVALVLRETGGFAVYGEAFPIGESPGTRGCMRELGARGIETHVTEGSR